MFGSKCWANGYADGYGVLWGTPGTLGYSGDSLGYSGDSGRVFSLQSIFLAEYFPSPPLVPYNMKRAYVCGTISNNLGQKETEPQNNYKTLVK